MQKGGVGYSKWIQIKKTMGTQVGMVDTLEIEGSLRLWVFGYQDQVDHAG